MARLVRFFDETRDDYFWLLFAVSARGQWREWLEYFLREVRQRAIASLRRTQKVLQILKGYRGKPKAVKRAPKSATAILDELFGNPLFSISRYSARTKQRFHNCRRL